jgi:hypothetical protein
MVAVPIFPVPIFPYFSIFWDEREEKRSESLLG